MKYTPSQYAAALTDALESAAPEARRDILRRFMRILARNKDTRRLGAILRQVARRSLAARGLRKVSVTSASPLPPRTKKDIEAALGTGALWEEAVDPAILGGVRILVDDELLIDATARRRLDRMFAGRQYS
jgi:F0F1-type ATP synthase delta subunit